MNREPAPQRVVSAALLEPFLIQLGEEGRKKITEYAGHRANGDDRISVARIVSPEGWLEAGQVAEFDEYFLVLSGTVRLTFRDGTFEIGEHQAALARAGEWVQHGTPHPGGAEYLAICLPSYAPDRVHSGATATPAPGEVESLYALDEAHLWHPWAPVAAAVRGSRRVFVSGSGCHLYDSEGRQYFDARSSSFNAGLGYGRADVVAAVSMQMQRLMTYDLVDASTDPPIRLAHKLSQILPPPLRRVFFCSGGSEAVEAAIKMVRIYQGLRGYPERTVLLGYAGGYHGPTLGAMGLYGSAFHQTGSGPLPEGFATLRHPSAVTGSPLTAEAAIAEVEEAISRAGGPSRVAAILLEPVQGNGGVRIPGPDFLPQLRTLCDREGILLVFDEIMTGCGRTGRMFAFEHWGVVPDVLLLSKCLTGGYMPLSALVTRDEIYAEFSHDPLLGGFRHGHTNTGHAAACAAGLAVLRAIESEGLVENARANGEIVLGHLRRLAAGQPAILDVRGLGLLIGLELARTEDGASRAERVLVAAAELGLLLRRSGEVIILSPPLTLSAADRGELLALLEQALRPELAPSL